MAAIPRAPHRANAPAMETRPNFPAGHARLSRFELRQVSRRWGDRIALEDVSLAIEPGERIALLGPSGAGKSTLMRLINATLRASSGVVLVDGENVATFSRRKLLRHRRSFGIVAQGCQLVPQLSVHRNVVAGLLPTWRWHKTLASFVVSLEKQRVAAALAKVGLADRQWDTTSTLSGGQQQRVAIARALIGTPEVILADEPTASLDPATAQEVTRLLLESTRSRAVTLIFCTHWITHITDIMDRIIGLRDGKVHFDANADNVSEADLDALYIGSNERY